MNYFVRLCFNNTKKIEIMKIERLFELAEETAKNLDANIKDAQDIVSKLESLLKQYNELLIDIKSVTYEKI